MIKHSDPIDLDDYVNKYFSTQGNASPKLQSMTQKEFEAISMKLTKDLYIIQ